MFQNTGIEYWSEKLKKKKLKNPTVAGKDYNWNAVKATVYNNV